MTMISHHKDEGQRQLSRCHVIKYILTHKCHKRHRYHQFNRWLSESPLLNLVKILVAPEDNKGLDRVIEHLYMYLHLPMRSPTKSRE